MSRADVLVDANWAPGCDSSQATWRASRPSVAHAVPATTCGAFVLAVGSRSMAEDPVRDTYEMTLPESSPVPPTVMLWISSPTGAPGLKPFAQTPPSMSRTWVSGSRAAGKYVGAAAVAERPI